MLRYAADEGYIDHNPVDDLGKRARPKVAADKRDVRVVDEAELERLFAQAPGDYALMFKFKAYTGLRGAELRGLVWGDLDLDAGRVTVTRQIDHEDRGVRVPLKSKTIKDRRTVPLMTELATELRDHQAKLAEWGRGEPADWVFPDGAGSHITHATFAYRFEAPPTRPASGPTRA